MLCLNIVTIPYNVSVPYNVFRSVDVETVTVCTGNDMTFVWLCCLDPQR